MSGSGVETAGLPESASPDLAETETGAKTEIRFGTAGILRWPVPGFGQLFAAVEAEKWCGPILVSQIRPV